MFSDASNNWVIASSWIGIVVTFLLLAGLLLVVIIEAIRKQKTIELVNSIAALFAIAVSIYTYANRDREADKEIAELKKRIEQIEKDAKSPKGIGANKADNSKIISPTPAVDAVLENRAPRVGPPAIEARPKTPRTAPVNPAPPNSQGIGPGDEIFLDEEIKLPTRKRP